MAEKEIELTFIRCPSCKCLMPSTAKKCGMCNFELSVSTPNENGAGATKDRGSQRSEPESSSSEDQPEPQRQQRSRLRQQSDPNLFKSPPMTASSLEHQATRIMPKYDGERAESPAFSPVEEVQTTTEKEDSYVRPRVDSRMADKLKNELSSVDNDDDQPENKSDNLGEEESPPRRKRKRRRRKKRPEVNSDEQISNQDALSSKGEVGAEMAVESIEDNSTDKNVDEELGNDQKMKNPTTADFIEKSPRKTEARVLDNPDLERDVRTSKQEKSAEVYSNSRPKVEEVEGKGMSKAMDNALLGWFVNYSNNKEGISFEIRAGRRFIGRQELREDDLLIQDSAVSTPHCLLQADGNGVHVQDLMSEHGTFIKKAGEAEFEKKDASVKLSHGDRLKFGAYELIVCLVPR